jgi:hypothetical protein
VGGFNFAFAMVAAPIAIVVTHRFDKFWTMAIGILCQTGGYIVTGFESYLAAYDHPRHPCRPQHRLHLRLQSAYPFSMA